MNTHLEARSKNPALTAETFRGVRAFGREAVMTIEGTVNKTAISLVILLATATWTWNLGLADPRTGGLLMLGVIGGFVTALVTVFKQNWAPLTTPAYAAFEGLALGGISAAAESRFPGIASQAIFLTFGTLGALLLAYRSGLIRATEKFKRGVFAATGGKSAGAEGLELPQPPRLSPKEATAVANCIRAWLECRNDELEARIQTLAETTGMVAKLLAERGIDVTGGGGLRRN